MTDNTDLNKHKDKPPVEEVAESGASPESALASAEMRAKEAQDAALRATAELQNLKRRQREEMDRIVDTSTKELVLSILPVVDDLERALESAASTQNFDSLCNGVNLTLSKLLGALRTVGVVRMPGVGEVFDPERHEAALQVEPSDAHPNGSIVQELRSGYTQHEHVIRPSLVAVAHE